MAVRTHVPKYRCYKPKNLGLVVINGRQHYLGKYGSPESLAEYNRLVQELLAVGPSLPNGVETKTSPTVNDVILAFWAHAERHYRKPDGSPSGEQENFRLAFRPLRSLYGHTPAADFGPAGLRSVRDAMVKSKLARTTTNARINRIRRAFKWAASTELIPAAVFHGLETVSGLQRGRVDVRETESVKPVAASDVEAALPYMPRPVAAMVRLQLLSGCRPGEVTSMRGRDLTPGEPNWEYRPLSHKNDWRGMSRVIALGPKAQAIVKEFMKPDPEAFLFSPQDTVERLHEARAQQRISKPTPSELGRRCHAPGRRHRLNYDRRTYRQAIVRACQKANLDPWSPLQLRHTTATTIRAKYGLEAAQAVLGHARADVTQVYAERDTAKAHEVMREIG